MTIAIGNLTSAAGANSFIELSGTIPFVRCNQDAISLLEGITSAEKAQSVPYIKIWQINPNTGEPIRKNSDGSPSYPLSLQFSKPPSFGLSVDTRFRERPNVSLDKITIKNEMVRGTMMYRLVDISFVAHNPAAVFNFNKDEDSWSTLLMPGAVHVLEYGWSASKGVKNEMLRGDDFVDKTSKPEILIPGRSIVYFTVVNYKFQIEANNEIRFSVEAHEAYHFNLKRAIPEYSTVIQSKDKKDENLAAKNGVVQTQPTVFNPRTKEGQVLLKNIQDILYSKFVPDVNGLVTFKQVCNNLFANELTNCFKLIGFNRPSLYLGQFNKKAGMTVRNYGGIDLTDKSIGEFKLPIKEVSNAFAHAISSGEQITIYNFMNLFFNIINNVANWDASKAKDKDGEKVKDTAIPEICLRSIVGKKDAKIYIFDKKRELVQWAFEQQDKNNILRDDLVKELRINGIPMISFGKGNSYIAGSNFDVIADEDMKNIFMRRAWDSYSKTRQEIVGQSNSVGNDFAVNHIDLLYSSAINGEITMLGNNIFDVLSTVWLDFGIKQWDGAFFISEKEDNISQTEFTTKIRFHSTGTDPLGTQGRAKLNAKIEEQDKQKQQLEAKRKATRINKKKQ